MAGNQISLIDSLGLFPSASHCFGVAAKANGLSIAVDVIGAVPLVGNVAQAIGLASGAYGVYTAVTAKPSEAANSIGLAGIGVASTLSDIVLSSCREPKSFLALAMPLLCSLRHWISDIGKAVDAYLTCRVSS